MKAASDRLLLFLRSLLPQPAGLRVGALRLGMAVLGAVLLLPLTRILPFLGWDWYFYFNNHNPALNLAAADSAYPPFTGWFIGLLTWLDWRTSLAVLVGLTLLAVALGTWQSGGRYGSIALALLTPPLWMLLWVGHPDGLALLGVVSGFVPLTLIKPQIAVWSLLSSRRLLAAAAVFGLLTLLIWPGWPLRWLSFARGVIAYREVLYYNEATFGWGVMGWPIALLGALLLAGAGTDAYRLMAAGCLLSPYLMPYHLAVLAPLIGRARGARKLVVWASAWLVLIGTGVRGPAKYLNLLFPLLAYAFSLTPAEYRQNLRNLYNTLLSILWVKPRPAGVTTPPDA